MYSLFIGRYQPLHTGHEKLIRTVLNEGRKVCVAIRDTIKRETDPYSFKQRKSMFKRVFKKL